MSHKKNDDKTSEKKDFKVVLCERLKNSVITSLETFVHFLPSAGGLVFVLAIFTVIGAGIFYVCEASHERQLVKHSRMAGNRLRVFFANEFLNVSKRYVKNQDVFVARSIALLQEYDRLREQVGAGEKMLWGNFLDAVFYTSTVYTTIGYGNVYPRTKPGKFFTVIYGLIGIPLCLVVLAELGKLLTRGIKTLFRKVKSDLDDSNFPINDEFDFSIVFAVAITTVYLLLGAIVYHLLEPEWTVFDAFYFIFISGSTIGFGDMVPTASRWFYFGGFLYTFGALILVSAIFAILQGKFGEAVHQSRSYLENISFRREKSTESRKIRTKPTEEEVAAIYGRAVDPKFKALEEARASGTEETVQEASPAINVGSNHGSDADEYEREVARIYGREPNSWQGKGVVKPAPAPAPVVTVEVAAPIVITPAPASTSSHSSTGTNSKVSPTAAVAPSTSPKLRRISSPFATKQGPEEVIEKVVVHREAYFAPSPEDTEVTNLLMSAGTSNASGSTGGMLSLPQEIAQPFGGTVTFETPPFLDAVDAARNPPLNKSPSSTAAPAGTQVGKSHIVAKQEKAKNEQSVLSSVAPLSSGKQEKLGKDQHTTTTKQERTKNEKGGDSVAAASVPEQVKTSRPSSGQQRLSASLSQRSKTEMDGIVNEDFAKPKTAINNDQAENLGANILGKTDVTSVVQKANSSEARQQDLKDSVPMKNDEISKKERTKQETNLKSTGVASRPTEMSEASSSKHNANSTFTPIAQSHEQLLSSKPTMLNEYVVKKESNSFVANSAPETLKKATNFSTPSSAPEPPLAANLSRASGSAFTPIGESRESPISQQKSRLLSSDEIGSRSSKDIGPDVYAKNSHVAFTPEEPPKQVTPPRKTFLPADTSSTLSSTPASDKPAYLQPPTLTPSYAPVILGERRSPQLGRRVSAFSTTPSDSFSSSKTRETSLGPSSPTTYVSKLQFKRAGSMDRTDSFYPSSRATTYGRPRIREMASPVIGYYDSADDRIPHFSSQLLADAAQVGASIGRSRARRAMSTSPSPITSSSLLSSPSSTHLSSYGLPSNLSSSTSYLSPSSSYRPITPTVIGRSSGGASSTLYGRSPPLSSNYESNSSLASRSYGLSSPRRSSQF